MEQNGIDKRNETNLSMLEATAVQISNQDLYGARLTSSLKSPFLEGGGTNRGWSETDGPGRVSGAPGQARFADTWTDAAAAAPWARRRRRRVRRRIREAA